MHFNLCRSCAPKHDHGRLLADEVRRIVTSPYALSLKHLHDVVDVIDGPLLQQWAEDHPCQIGPLVQAILEGLEHSPYALITFAKLADVESIRNEVLRQRPALLDSLLRKATTCGQCSDQYSAACIVLLRKPLPGGIATPNAILPFLSRLLGAAIESPSAASIRPVYSLLTRRQSTLVQLLPTEVVRSLHDRLLRVLKHSNQQVNLLCLGVFSRLVSGYRSRRELDRKSSAELSSNDLHWQHDAVNIESIEKFFNEIKAPKTIRLVVLGAISACSESSPTSLGHALETLSLATEIMDTVETSIKTKWMDDNHPTMQKLYEKICRAGLLVDLQSQALEFAVSLMGSERLPIALVSVFQNLILDTMRASICCSSRMQLSTRVLEGFIGRVDDRFIRSVLREVLQTSVEQIKFASSSSQRSRFSTELIYAFTRITLGLPTLGKSILRAFSTEEFSEPLRSFIEYSLPCLPPSACENLDACPVASTEARRELCISLCSLILQVIMQGAADESRVELSLSLKLLEKQREFALPSPSCKFRSQTSNTASERISFLEQMSTPEDPSVSHNWAERLASNLLRDAQHKHELVVRMVGEVCRDLEDRCATVEAPLRKEQARALNLSEELHTAQSELSQLKSEAGDHRLLLNNMEVDRGHLKEQVKSLEMKAQDMTEETERLRQQLQVLSRDAETALTAANERADQQALEHLAILNVKEETIEELREKVDEMEGFLHEAHEELKRKREECNEAGRRADLLEDQVQSKSEEIELQKVTAAEQEERIRALCEVEQSLREKMGATDEDLRKSAAEAEALRVRLDHTEKSLSGQVEELTRARDSYAAENTAKEAQLRQRHQDEIYNLKSEAQLERQSMLLEQQRKESKILELEEKIERFKRERLAKAKEFAEAQDLSRRLLAVVGASTTHTAPLSSAGGGPLSFDEDSFGMFASQRNTLLGKAQPQTQKSESRSEKSTQDSPTPKRHRQRKSQNLPAFRQVRAAHGAKTIHPTLPHDFVAGTGRRPLGETQGCLNRGGSVAARVPERHSPGVGQMGNNNPLKPSESGTRRDECMSMEMLPSSLNGDFLSSTQKQDASDSHLPRSDSFCDETTMNF